MRRLASMLVFTAALFRGLDERTPRIKWLPLDGSSLFYPLLDRSPPFFLLQKWDRLQDHPPLDREKWPPPRRLRFGSSHHVRPMVLKFPGKLITLRFFPRFFCVRGRHPGTLSRKTTPCAARAVRKKVNLITKTSNPSNFSPQEILL